MTCAFHHDNQGHILLASHMADSFAQNSVLTWGLLIHHLYYLSNLN